MRANSFENEMKVVLRDSVRADVTGEGGAPTGSLNGPGSFAYLLGDTLLLTPSPGLVREAFTVHEFIAGS
ncbi:Copper-transporting ATPase 2, partial [Clarias magur]